MVVATAVIELHLPAIHSLKQKRSALKSLIARLHREFNVSCGEVGHNDAWQSAAVGIAVVSNNAAHAAGMVDTVVEWIERNRPDLMVVDHTLEIIS